MGENEITVSYPSDSTYSSLMPNKVPLRALKFAEVPRFRGKTRAWNQLMQNGNFASGDGWVLESGVTASFSDNVATISSTTSSNGIRREIDFINGHKYLVSAEINTESALDVKFGSSSSGGAQVQITTSVFNQFVKYSEIKTASANTYQFYIFVSSTYSNLKVRNVTLYDLTLIFGSGNEPATVADALTALPALAQYNAYDAGSLVSTTVEGVEAIGPNIWDEETELGTIGSNGQNLASNSNLRSKNFIPIVGGQTLYRKCTYSGYHYFYDADKNYISGSETYDGANEHSMEVPLNARFMRFYLGTTYGTTYNHDIQICLNSYSDKTTYHPYKTDTLSLSSPVTLRGVGTCVETLDLETGVLDDGKFGLVDLGDLDWDYDSTYKYFYTNQLVNSYGAKFPNWTNLVASRLYVTQNNTHWYDDVTKDMIIGIAFHAHNNALNIRNLAYTDATTFKNAMSGVYLLYEKATYTPSAPIDPVPYNFLEVEGGGTVDTIQTQTPVIDNCLDVTYDIIPQ